MKAVVTGGTGFVGKALSLKLKSLGWEVFSLSRGESTELKEKNISHNCIDLVTGYKKLVELFKGVEVVFHTAAKVDMWGKYQDFYNINVNGTENVIKACKEAKVKYLVYTSSPSVVANGKSLKGVNEDISYPNHYIANYPKTKSLAEQLVLSVNSSQLKACALRPHLIWGPGDTNLIPTIIAKASKGKLIQVGKGENLVDLTYIDDCISAHILAYEALKNGDAAAGEAFFISQGEPVKLWEWIAQILEIYKLKPIKKKIPEKVAYFLAGIMEVFCRPINVEPLFTRFLVEQMSVDHYFDISKASKILGYKPRVSVKEGMRFLKA